MYTRFSIARRRLEKYPPRKLKSMQMVNLKKLAGLGQANNVHPFAVYRKNFQRKFKRLCLLRVHISHAILDFRGSQG
jgi:hypothetical protein